MLFLEHWPKILLEKLPKNVESVSITNRCIFLYLVRIPLLWTKFLVYWLSMDLKKMKNIHFVDNLCHSDNRPVSRLHSFEIVNEAIDAIDVPTHLSSCKSLQRLGCIALF